MSLFISESYGTDRHLWCTSEKNTWYFSKGSPKRYIWSATEIIKGTCCVQQLADTHNLLDVTHQQSSLCCFRINFVSLYATRALGLSWSVGSKSAEPKGKVPPDQASRSYIKLVSAGGHSAYFEGCFLGSQSSNRCPEIKNLIFIHRTLLKSRPYTCKGLNF